MANLFATVVVLAAAAGDVPDVDATRYRLTFPGVERGQRVDVDTFRYWRVWLRGEDYDVAGTARTEGYLDVVLREGDSIEKLLARGFEIVERERTGSLSDKGDLRGLNGFVDPAELLTFLNAEASDHPTITQLTSIGQTHQGRDIWCMEVSNNPGVAEDEPSILLNSLHHAREIVTPHVVMDAITYLTDQYAAGDPQVVDWVDNYKIFCVPMVNPDGSERVHNGGDAFHRKNLRPVCTGGNLGVDLNRNYTYHWGSGTTACERSPTGGSSGSTCSDAYRGPSPASEPEAQAMMALANQQRFLVAVSYHASGRFIDYPYACNDGNPDNRMPEHAVIDEMMHGMAAGIFAVDGVNYDVFSPIAIGPVNGDDTSWYYAHNATYAMLVEIGTSFQPSFATGTASVARNRGGWQYLLDRMGRARIDVRVVDHLTGAPIAAEVELLDFVFDTDELPRIADPQFGRSRWLVPANDTYTVQSSAAGFETRLVQASVTDQPVEVTVLLLPLGTVLGDGDGDGDVDLADFGRFEICFEESPITPACRILDMNADQRVTLRDLAGFESVLLGPQ